MQSRPQQTEVACQLKVKSRNNAAFYCVKTNSSDFEIINQARSAQISGQ